MPFGNVMKCCICSRETREALLLGATEEKRFLFFRWQGGRTTAFCRDHLFAPWRERFLSGTQRLIAFDPVGNLDPADGLSVQYWYASIERLAGPNPSVSKKDKERRADQYQSWLDSVSGSCANCEAEAMVGYVPQTQTKFTKKGMWHNLELDGFTPQFQNLCRPCAFAAIERSMRNSQVRFVQAIDVPTEQPGLYVTVTM